MNARKPVSPSAGGTHRALVLGSVVLFLVGFVYLMHGCYSLFTSAGDYEQRWVEEHYVFRGKNPIDILERDQEKVPPDHGRDSRIDADLGPTRGFYPPWAYFTGAALTWIPNVAVARTLYGVFILGLLAGLLLWVFRLGNDYDWFLGLFFAASLFAVNSVCTTLMLGQYGLLVLACLIAAYLLDEKDHWLAAGFCLGIALTKVTLAGPFMFPFLLRRRWRPLAVAGCYILIGSLVIWPIIKTNPIEMLGQMTRASKYFPGFGYGLDTLLAFFGMDPPMITKVTATTPLLLGVGVLYLWRSASILTQYAVAGLIARAWSFHALYDNLILVFLLLELGLTAWRTRSPLALGSFLLVGVTLWLPGRLTHILAWMIAQWLIWIAGVAVLLFLKREDAATELAEA